MVRENNSSLPPYDTSFISSDEDKLARSGAVSPQNSEQRTANSEQGAGSSGNGTSAAASGGGTSTTSAAAATSSTPSSSSSSSSSNTTTSVSAAKPYYTQFSGNNYAELEDFVRQQMEGHKPESEEERKKRERREKWEGVISGISDMGMALSNLFFTTQYAPNAYDAKNSLSGKAKERFEKAKAEREKEQDRYVNYAITLGKLKDADRDFQFRLEQARNQQNNFDRQFDAGRQDRAEDVAHRDKVFQAGRDDRKADVEFRDKQFDEGKRQFDVTAKEHERHNRVSEGLQGASIAEQRRHNKVSEVLSWANHAASQDGKYMNFYTPSGMIKVPQTNLNQHNISYVFRQTPTQGRPTGSFDLSTGQQKPVSSEQMMDWIGQNADNPDVQSALRRIGGLSDRGTGYDGGNGRGRGY